MPPTCHLERVHRSMRHLGIVPFLCGVLTVLLVPSSRLAAVAAQEEPEPIPAGLAPPPGPYAPGMDVLHYDLELALVEAERFLALARVRVRLTDPLPDELTFDLSGLAVTQVRVDGRDAPFRLDEGRLLVSLPRDADSGQELDVSVSYGGVPDDGLILRENVHGAPSAFADNWPNRARFWFPSVDHPSDKATVTFTVHAPSAWTVIANGRQVGEPMPTAEDALGDPSGKRTWRWQTDVPIPSYTMVVGAADLEVREVGLGACGDAPASPREDGCVVVSYWVFPEDVERARPSFRRAVEMTDFFTEVVGPFPYEKLAHVQSATRFGGMENSSAIFYSEQAIAEGRDIEGTVSHEIAHQWFGDSATEADWSHLWLSEGFATYFGNFFFERADGIASMRRRMAEDRAEYLRSGSAARPVIATGETDLFELLNENNYEKGGWVLHMLRDLVGDDAFFEGVRTYYARHANDTALTADLQAAMEEVSGEELGWFFEQWLHHPGHPVLRTAWQGDTGEVELTIEQVQPGDWPTFHFPLTVELTHRDGSTRRERIEVTERRQTFRLAASGPVARVAVDPDESLLKELLP